MKRGRGRPRKSAESLGRRRTLRFTDGEDREVEAALALERQEFSEMARPAVLERARRIIEKARKR